MLTLLLHFWHNDINQTDIINLQPSDYQKYLAEKYKKIS